MALGNLGSNLYNAIQKLIKAPVVDEATVKELVKDFQRALLQADVNVALVMELSQNIQNKALDEKLPPGITQTEFGQLVGVGQPSVSLWLRGERHLAPAKETLARRVLHQLESQRQASKQFERWGKDYLSKELTRSLT